jgi:LPS-assembly protein
MKIRIQIIFFIIFFSTNTFADSVQIEAKKMSLDKDGLTSIFENEVVVTTKEKIIKSNFVKYNKGTGYLLIKDKVVATDYKNNIVKTDFAEYYEKDKIFKSFGPTTIITSDKYILEGSDILVDNIKKIINSNKKSILTDQENNKIYLENFEYLIAENIFKSVGNVKIIDNKKNDYQFSQIYIDTKKKEILGADIQAFINDENLKINKKNKPRIFANSLKLDKDKNVFNKSIFTLCDYRKGDKCPPWSIQSSQMLHDNKKKTIYYKNAIIKVYDIPIFYFPSLSHPDPTVDRRSGFLPPSISDSKNLGAGVSVPYFFDIAKNKNFTLTNRLYASENPLFFGEYHQALKDSFLMADFGYTEGYKKTSSSKQKGEKSHFFTKYAKNFQSKNNSENNLSFSIQEVSDDKYLKLYKIQSNLVDYNIDTLENSFNFTRQGADTFFGLDAIMYETLKEDYEDKYEYIFPQATFDKNLFNDERLGNLQLQTNLKVRSYDTNKLENFFVNDFNWESRNASFNSGVSTKILGNLKNINYEAKNTDVYKEDTTNELFGALGLLSELNLQKKQGNSEHFLTPKILLRVSPGSMRKLRSGSKLDSINAYNLNRINDVNNYETGLSSTLGFDYKIKKPNNDFDFSVAQVINEKENKKMADITSMNEKLSDLVGSAKLTFNEKTNLKYDFSIDQNYNDINYSEIGASTKLGPINFNFDYLQENKHIGDQNYFKTKIDFTNNENRSIAFETKRNLITNSSEFYNLSYEYMNDCLRAGLVYRREFYKDSELEPEDSLMFKITLVPFGKIDSPAFSN